MDLKSGVGAWFLPVPGGSCPPGNTIRLIYRTQMAIGHSSRVVEQAEHHLEMLERRVRQRRHDHAALMARMHEILDRPLE
jgi:hypothetical protein